MSDAEFLAYAGSLAVAGLLFLILAVLGFGQGLVLRGVDVLLGLAFLGYAGYLMVAAPDDPFTTWLVFVTPVIGLGVAVTARQRARSRLRRLEEEHTSRPYAGQDATVKERQPYPSPPAPLDPTAPAPSRKQSGPAVRTGGTPSGLPAAPPPSGLGQSPQEAAPRPPRPSGLPQMHAEPADAPPRGGWPPQAQTQMSPSHSEPGYRARHGAADEETAHHNYSGGRHRADGES